MVISISYVKIQHMDTDIRYKITKTKAGDSFQKIMSGPFPLPPSLALVISFLALVILYAASLNGEPLFDDYFYIFNKEAVSNSHSFWNIFTMASWPMSIAAEKIFYLVWHENYFYFHLVNLLLHFLNSYLLLRIAKKLALAFPYIIFLLFLVHPSNVISVSWMVQLKTLLCFTFCITSFLFLLRALEDKRYYALSWFTFLLSALSKSSSLPISIFFIIFGFSKKGKGQLVWMLPFLVISSYSSFKVLGSKYLEKTNLQYQSKTYIGKIKDKNEVPVRWHKVDESKTDALEEVKTRAVHFLKTSYYYFWQVILPLSSPPIPGQSNGDIGVTEIFNIFFILILAYLNWGFLSGICLLSGYLMMTPFLGIIRAPYMSLTLVSEQHLYLALPFFLIFWIGLLSKLNEKIKFKYVRIIPVFFIVLFSTQTFKAVKYYENEIIFYATSLKSDPHNMPLLQNLVVAFVRKGDIEKAINLTTNVLELAKKDTKIENSKYFPNFVKVHTSLIEMTGKAP